MREAVWAECMCVRAGLPAPPPLSPTKNRSMNMQDSKSSGRRRGPRRRRHNDEGEQSSSYQPQRDSRSQYQGQTQGQPAARTSEPKLSFFQKILSFFGFGPKAKAYPAYEPAPRITKPTERPASNQNAAPAQRAQATPRPTRKPEAVEVTSPKLYVGNLSFDAAENDLSELFNGVGIVRTVEIVTYKDTEKSKGFGFVTMTAIDEAKRAVSELHDKEFMGRRLVVSGAKTNDRA